MHAAWLMTHWPALKTVLERRHSIFDGPVVGNQGQKEAEGSANERERGFNCESRSTPTIRDGDAFFLPFKKAPSHLSGK